ncbi:hypothetical protein TNCV_2023061 [Trichonephila clavipes]|nr:hypothetical protein TNCV_2023061 [Trichonephila clavipes]
MAWFHLNFEEHLGVGQLPRSSLPSTNLMRGLAARRLFKAPHATQRASSKLSTILKSSLNYIQKEPLGTPPGSPRNSK